MQCKIIKAVACCRDGSGRELTVEDAGRRRGGRQCGLCSLVARAFRRAVCGAPSRRGSGDSCQELTAPLAEEEKVSNISIETNISTNCFRLKSSYALLTYLLYFY